MAAACLLAFWTRSPAQIERLLRRTQLHREKWDTHKDCLSSIIAGALHTVTKFYDWAPATSEGSTPSDTTPPKRSRFLASRCAELGRSRVPP